MSEKFYWKENVTGIGRSRGHAGHAPHGTQFFRFRNHFHQKVPALEVHASPNGCTPSTGNPGSATDWYDERDLNYKLIFIGPKCKWPNRENTNMAPDPEFGSRVTLGLKGKSRKINCL